MSTPLTGSPEETYATKPNILRPGTSTQATAAAVLADTKADERLASGGVDNVTIAIANGSIEEET